MTPKPRINLRFAEDVLAAVDGEVARRRRAGQKADRTQLMEDACREVYGAKAVGQAKAKGRDNGRP